MTIDFGNGFSLRHATADDHPALSMICLRTGDAGADATAREDDPELLGLIYALPYQVFEPAFAFLLEGPAGPCGYVLGARDTATFNERLTHDWFPALRRRIADPGSDRSTWRGSDWARHLIHHPGLAVHPDLAAYPSHGHIDLLPEARGHGLGRRAMAALENALAAAGSPGLFLEVAPRNRNALAFYAAVGFAPFSGSTLPAHSVFMTKPLRPAPAG